MEQHFYRDDFEQMLKDSTEDFRMYPSRKVWHSIYNDLHPDRKWPSFAVCLLLLVSILHIGVSNNNHISKNARNIMLAANSALESGDQPNIGSTSNTTTSVANPENTPGNIDHTTTPYSLTTELSEGQSLARTTVNPLRILFSRVPVNKADLNLPELVSVPFVTSFVHLPIIAKIDSEEKAEEVGVSESSGRVEFNIQVSPAKEPAEFTTKVIAPTAPLVQNKFQKQTTKDFAAIAWMEDFAFHNVKNKIKWKTNTSFQYYVTPSLGYRSLNKNNEFEPSTGALLRTNDNEAVTQQAAPGFEAGAQILVGLSKKLRFKAGLQYNYTKYITYAHELQHPSQATVLMNDMNNRFVIPVSYNSYHANVLGSNFDRLSNTTNQISLPIGFDYKLAGNNRIKWYVGSSIQPSYVASGNAVLISYDSKNFVNDASVLRKFNMNSSLETFVSLKTPSGIDINVGPQVRYQLLSTYKKEYTYTEKLYNLGIKIGLTKKL